MIAAKWSIGAAMLGFAMVAYGQDPGAASAVPGLPTSLADLVHAGGLPAALAWAAWTLRGVLSAGIPVTVSLSAADRELLTERRTGGTQS